MMDGVMYSTQLSPFPPPFLKPLFLRFSIILQRDMGRAESMQQKSVLTIDSIRPGRSFP